MNTRRKKQLAFERERRKSKPKTHKYFVQRDKSEPKYSDTKISSTSETSEFWRKLITALTRPQ